MRFMRTTRVAVGGLALVALMATGAAPAGAEEAPPSDTARCRFGTWPAGAEGQPAGFAPGAATGVYLWHTDQGWRLRVTHPGTEKVVFKGTIISSSPLAAVERRTESRDVTIRRARNQVSFRFANYGRVDGIDFRMACGKGFLVKGSINGVPLTADQVYVGAGGGHPDHVPFRISRQA